MLQQEEKIRLTLIAKFPFLQDAIRVTRSRRLFAKVTAEQFPAVFDYAIKEGGFIILCTITGLDLGNQLGAIYHLAQENGIMLNLETAVPKENPRLSSVRDRFPAADAYERELIDLLGFQISGLPEGNRYPLPDDWPAGQYPLRKDWQSKTVVNAIEAKEASHAENK